MPKLLLSSLMHPIKTGSFPTFLLPPSSPLIWQSLCNLELKWLFLKMPWALGSWYFPLITVPHYHRKALSTSLALLITLLRLPWHILSFADALLRAYVRVSEKGVVKEQGQKRERQAAACLHWRNILNPFLRTHNSVWKPWHLKQINTIYLNHRRWIHKKFQAKKIKE